MEANTLRTHHTTPNSPISFAMSHFDPQQLERQIHRTLRSLPDRRAPRSLEARVLASIAARRALPWWRQSFTHWPAPARVGFALSTFAFLMVLTMTTMGGLPAVAALWNEWLAPLAGLRAAIATLGDAASLIWQRIPTLWLYGALASFAALYATLFGLGATAYRTLVVHR